MSTFGALCAATVAAAAAHRQLAHMRAGEQQRQDTERRQQADKVCAWISADHTGISHVYFTNASNLPVYAVTVRCRVPWHLSGPLPGIVETELGTQGPTSEAIELHKVNRDLLRTAGDQLDRDETTGAHRFNPDSELASWQAGTWGQLVEREVHIGLAFLDAAAAAWSRQADGTLTEHRKLGQAQDALLPPNLQQ